jgi:hypothetical protein
VLSLAAQTSSPDEAIAVARDTDTPAHESIASLQQALPSALRRQPVSAHGAGGGWDGTGHPVANVPIAACCRYAWSKLHSTPELRTCTAGAHDVPREQPPHR